jgi:hypothetical protein
MITHSLSGGGKGMKGYDALDCIMISRWPAGVRLGRFNELCFLPDKEARFLFEFHTDDYESLRLPAIPSFTSSGDIHQGPHRAEWPSVARSIMNDPDLMGLKTF